MQRDDESSRGITHAILMVQTKGVAFARRKAGARGIKYRTRRQPAASGTGKGGGKGKKKNVAGGRMGSEEEKLRGLRIAIDRSFMPALPLLF